MQGEYFTSNPEADADAYAREGDDWINSRPICRECGEPITDEYAYKWGAVWYCKDCIEEHKEWID